MLGESAMRLVYLMATVKGKRDDSIEDTQCKSGAMAGGKP